MIWLTWRQHRLQAAIGATILALLVAGLLATKGQLDAYARDVAACATALSCAEARDGLAHFVDSSPLLHYMLPALPLLVGAFVGASLVAREMEQGTLILLWTQSVTRQRWLAIKLAALVGLSLLTMDGLVAFMAWWCRPIDAAIGPWPTFDVHGPAPLAYALFALALGTACGAAVRHTVGAIALTAGSSVSIRLAMASWLRPRFRPPRVAIEPFHLRLDLRGRDWVLSVYPVDHLGRPLRQYMEIVQMCDAVSRNGYAACLHDHGVYLRTIYQPADRFWLFQGIETATFLGLTCILLAVAFAMLARA